MESASEHTSKIIAWVNDRIPLGQLRLFLSRKEVPRHRSSIWYIFGGLTLFFFIVQIISGMLLMVYYSPTPETAYQSVQMIVTQVSFGWLIRSMHSWSANLMIVMLFIHLGSVFFMKAYRKPREFMWISGVLLMFIVLGFAFTGYLLPWDTTAYFATQIGTEIPRSIPVVGEIIVKILRGGEYIGAESIKRLFALHVVILPIISLMLVCFHLILNQIHGSSVPIGKARKLPSIPFYPNYLYRDAISWSGALFLLCTLAFLFPVHLGTKAEPFASAPVGIKPEWYFLPLFETLRLMPAEILGINSEIAVNIIVGAFGSILLLVPFIDGKAQREESGKVLTFVGAGIMLYMCLSILLAYIT